MSAGGERPVVAEMHVARATLNPGFDDEFLGMPVSSATDRVAIELNCIAAAVRSAFKHRLLLSPVNSREQHLLSEPISDMLHDKGERSRGRTEKSATGEICDPGSGRVRGHRCA